MPDGVSAKLRPIVRPDVGWNSPDNEQVRQRIDYVDLVELSLHPNHQALAAELIDDVQRSADPAILSPMMDEVVGPDVIDMLRPEADARSIVKPQPTPLWLFHGNLEPLTTLQGLDPIVVQLPAVIPQHGSDPPIAVMAMLSWQLDHIPDQLIFIITRLRDIAVC